MKNLMMVIAAVASFGCLHTREVETGTTDPQKEAPAKEEQAPSPQKPEQKAAAKPPGKPTSSPVARPPVEEGRPELSVSPAGLMLPEGPRQIQQALTRLGYLPSDQQTGELDTQTSGALRKFQGDQKLARTGSPDRETVRRLGLSAEKIFRSSKKPQPNS